jgi:PAS domain S-box-containing protein
VVNPQKLKELEVFFDLTFDLACIFQLDGSFQMLNSVWEQVTGWTVEALQSSPWIEFVHPEDVALTQECLYTLSNQMVSSSIVQFENRWLHKDGSYSRLAWRVSLVEEKVLYAIAREISPINPDLQQLQVELQQTQDALRRSEEHFAKAFRANLIPACITTLQDGRFVDVNDSLLKLSGYNREELVGRTATELGLWVNVEDRSKVFQLLHQKESIDNLEVQFRIKSGEIRHGVASYEIIELNNQFCTLSQIYDVTKYKQAEEKIKASLREKEVLLKEIHHRVKNNLQIISSLLDLQSQYLEDSVTQSLLRDSCNRVKSMALVHETLYQSSDCAKVNFTEYIESLVINLFQAYRVDSNQIILEKKFDDVDLSIDRAIPCGLIISELVSNALKYAFPNKQEGKIYLLLHCEQDKRCTLIVRDNGVGLPSNFSFKHLNSLGLNLVKILTEQLEGTLKLNYYKGTEFCIEFPQRN